MKDDVYYKAMLARDYRFDGQFFVGVKTTGIYCRPICPAKPKRENVEFFASSTAAERAGYRPCLRCRPESAPLSPAWFGTSAIVQRALRAISADGFFSLDEDAFAAQFGVSARHLRRLFIDEVGQTPKQIAFNNRLGFARKLILESRLPLTSVASSAGFSSLRRFNDAFKKRFHRSPSDLRKKRGRGAEDENAVVLSLSYRPPFDWRHLLEFYRSHRIAGVETVTETTYERLFRMGRTSGHFIVSHDESDSCLRLQVRTEDPAILFAVAQRVRRMFDLDSDPLLIANSFRGHRVLNSLWKKNPGLRLARGWDPFEAAVCTILGQLVSMTQARALIAQLVEAYGERVEGGSLFPTPAVLMASDLAKVKTTQGRRGAIREFSRRVATGELDLAMPEPAFRERVQEIPGIGPWSAEYISLRALGDADAFPGTDLILKRAVSHYADLNLEDLRPWRSYAAVYLWKAFAETSKGKPS